MRNLIIFSSLLILFFTSCDKEKASLNLVEGKNFKVAEIILIGAGTDVTLNPTDAFLRFGDCNSSQNSDNNCELSAELDGITYNFTFQAQGERNNEFVTIRRSPNDGPTLSETADLLDVMTYTFKIDRADDSMELSCVDCPTNYQGQLVNERLIRLEE